ncbi:MAG: N-acetyltransferase [Acidobacteria bacterium]|nr:N-acetyltransferase [Acidobacteriota bacterium]MBI3425817.1 N-acetyltransferase [Acidobacteriota bacterium]
MTIRPEQPEDVAAIRQVIEAAFGRAAEADLVDSLRANDKAVVALVAESDGQIVGYILFSEVTLETNPPAIRIIGLAPLAVAPAWQKRGIGSQLTETGLTACRAAGYDAAIVLGHPAYYPRFGFVPASRFGLRSEYDVRDEVFMAMELRTGALAGCCGLAKYQPEFNEV